MLAFFYDSFFGKVSSTARWLEKVCPVSANGLSPADSVFLTSCILGMFARDARFDDSAEDASLIWLCNVACLLPFTFVVLDTVICFTESMFKLTCEVVAFASESLGCAGVTNFCSNSFLGYGEVLMAFFI